jgi:hypothetical protein
MSVAGAILLIYLRIQQKKAKLESRRSSALKLVKHAFTLTIATVADIYPWLCLQTILSNSSSCLLADEYLTKAIALANILLGVLLGLFFLIYTLRKQHDQQNILIVRKRESNILMLAL